MTQYLQNDLKDFKNILYAYSLCHKDVLRRFWFQSEKNKIFQNFKMRPDGPLGSHCGQGLNTDTAMLSYLGSPSISIT